MKIVLDGDLYAYQYAASNEEWMEVDGWLLPQFDLKAMRDQWREFIEDSLPRHDELVIALSGTLNFRKRLDPTYKSQRTKPKPIMYKPFIEWLTENYHVVFRPNLEGDDIVGLWGTEHSFTMISGDKDLLGVPGYHFDLKENKPFTVSLVEANRHWMTQTLTGDPTDGYKGCPGIGTVNANRMLSGVTELSEMWNIVRNCFVSRNLPEGEAIKQARLARILRAGDYDHTRNQVNLWQPNTGWGTP